MTKISALPQDTAPTLTDSVATLDNETTTTKRTLLSAIAALFFTQTNIPAGGGSPVTRQSETMFDYVASGGVWSGDAYASTRAASMTAMVCYINGRRISISAVTSRTFTASKDTYVDVLDNADGTGTLVYTEATNNAASPALASNSLRIAIIVTGASNITDAGSVNQGQETRVLPIASSIPYAVTDSLGNLICPRDPNRKILGYRQVTANATATTIAQIVGLSVPISIPTGRKIKITLQPGTFIGENTSGTQSQISLWDGVVSSGTQLQESGVSTAAVNQSASIACAYVGTLAAGSHTINGGMRSVGAGTTTLNASTTTPAFILVELV